MISIPPKGDKEKRVNANFTPLMVEAQVAPSMTVKIQPGSFWTAMGTHVEYIGGNTPVLTAPGADAKWIVIALNVDGVIVVLDGTSGANPELPTIPEDALPLAGIFLGDASVQITSDMVFDIRPMWSVRTAYVPNLTGELATRPTFDQQTAALAVKADMVGTDSASFVLNQSQTGTSSTDVEIVVERGSEPNVSIRWDETAVQWQFSNDGSAWGPLGLDLALFYTKANLDGGALDTMYYTETESDAMFAPIVHTHVATDVTDFDAAVLAELNTSSIGVLSDVDVTTSAPALGHALLYTGNSAWEPRLLVEADISDMGTYEVAFSKKTAFNVDFGSAAGTVCVGNDGRLSDDRTPLAHTHVKADITDFSDGDYATAVHTHVKADITDFVEGDYATAAQGTVADSALQDITGESIKSLSDVFTAMVPADGEVLTFDTTNGWQSEAVIVAPVDSVAGKTGVVVLVEADVTDLDKYTVAAADALLDAKAPIASPAFTGSIGLPILTLAGAVTLDATTVIGHQIYISDATGSGFGTTAVLGSVCFSNGATWIDVTTGITAV